MKNQSVGLSPFARSQGLTDADLAAAIERVVACKHLHEAA